MANYNKQTKNDIIKYYKGAYHANLSIPGRSKLSWNHWERWMQQTVKGIKSLILSELKSHWRKNKNYYMSNDNIPDKWKSNKYYLYTWKDKSKKWLFVCTIDGNKVTVVGACNYKALNSDINDEYVMIKEALFISLTQYINQQLRLHG